MTDLTSGTLWFYFQNALLLTVPVSIIVLFWYRRAVARSMRTASSAPDDSDGLDNNHAAHGLGLATEALHTGAGLHSRDSTGNKYTEERFRVRLLAVYGLAGMAAAAVLAGLQFLSSGREFSVFRAFAVWYVYCWPLIPTLAALLVMPRRRALLAFAGYVLVGAAIISLWSVFSHFVLGRADVSPLTNARSFVALLVYQAWLPYLLVLITGARRLRTVSPLVLAGLLVFSFSTLIVHFGFVAAFDYPSLRHVLLSFGAETQYLLFMVASLPIGYACWCGLRWLGQRFEGKSFSDAQLLVDSWWLIIISHNCVTLSTVLGWRGLLGLLAFAVYRITVAVGLAFWPIDPSSTPQSRLLLLRVFGFQRRSEKLFDAIGQRWRFVGSVQMIAGADLAMRTLDPSDFILFVGGRLRQLFVRDNRDLAQRLMHVDEARDPDGRFRINEFFCYDNTWRPTLTALLRRSNLVLMDLRGFSETNCGCVFELQQLAEHGCLPQTSFVIDDTTNVKLLEATLMPYTRHFGTPATDMAWPHLNLARVKSQAGSELHQIYGALHTLMGPPMGAARRATTPVPHARSRTRSPDSKAASSSKPGTQGPMT